MNTLDGSSLIGMFITETAPDRLASITHTNRREKTASRHSAASPEPALVTGEPAVTHASVKRPAFARRRASWRSLRGTCLARGLQGSPELVSRVTLDSGGNCSRCAQ